MTKKVQKQAPGIISLVRKRYYLAAYLGGLVYYGYQLRWLRSIQTADLVSSKFLAHLVGFSSQAITVAVFAVTPVLFLGGYRQLKLRLDQARTVWLAPLLWVGSELLRSWLFSVVAAGPGSRLGDYWHFGNIGLWLVDTPLVFLSRLGGPYLLSFVMALFLVTIIYTAKMKAWRPAAMVVVAAISLNAIAYVVYKAPDGRELSIAAVGMAAPQDESRPTDAIMKQLDSLAAHQADVVFLPEYSHYWEYDQQSETDAMKRVLKDPSGLVIHSVQGQNYFKKYNDVTFAGSDGVALQTQHKRFLIPGGEYVPYLYRGILNMTGQRSVVAQFEAKRGITPGEKSERPFVWRETSFGAMACSGANVPGLYRQLAQQGAEVLSNQASLGVLGSDSRYHQQSFAEVRLHAVANARPFAQSSRGGYIFILDQNGQTLAANESGGDGVIAATITTNGKRTPYTTLGDFVGYTSLLGSLGYILYLKTVQTSKHKS